MTLSVGAQLGPFEITGTLGKGGMGEVYRGRDAQLERGNTTEKGGSTGIDVSSVS